MLMKNNQKANNCKLYFKHERFQQFILIKYQRRQVILLETLKLFTLEIQTK